MKTARFYFPGIALFVTAFLVLSFPEILIAFASGVIIMAGFFALYIGHRIRLFQSTMGKFEGKYGQRPFDNYIHEMSYAKIWSNRNR